MYDANRTRSMTAPTTRVERVAKRIARDQVRHDRNGRRAAQPEASQAELAALSAYVASLTECHRITYDPKDWASVAARGLLERPKRVKVNEAAARKALVAFRPSLWDRFFGLDRDRRRALAGAIAEASSRDEAAYRAACKIVDAHNAEVEFALRLLALDVKAIGKTLSENTTLDLIGPAIEGVRLHVPERGRLIARIAGLELEDMPDEDIDIVDGKALFRSARRADMGRMHRLNVCSAALRVAAEVLSAAPVESVEVVVECDFVDRLSQDVNRAPILHVKIAHAAMVELDLEKIDPVQTILGFGCQMSWTPGQGFAPVETLNLTLPVAA